MIPATMGPPKNGNARLQPGVGQNKNTKLQNNTTVLQHQRILKEGSDWLFHSADQLANSLRDVEIDKHAVKISILRIVRVALSISQLAQASGE